MQDIKKLEEALGFERHSTDVESWRKTPLNESPYFFGGAYYDYTPTKAAKSERKESLKRIVLFTKRWRKNKLQNLALMRVEKLFSLRNSQAICSFLERNGFLIPLLIEANIEIKKHFPDSRLYLDLISDPEVDERQLFLYICTNLTPREARPNLNRLDNDWWLAALDRARGKLCVSLEYQ
jgi:hypothetical protein